jgi:hypothetical protein
MRYTDLAKIFKGFIRTREIVDNGAYFNPHAPEVRPYSYYLC